MEHANSGYVVGLCFPNVAVGTIAGVADGKMWRVRDLETGAVCTFHSWDLTPVPPALLTGVQHWAHEARMLMQLNASLSDQERLAVWGSKVVELQHQLMFFDAVCATEVPANLN